MTSSFCIYVCFCFISTKYTHLFQKHGKDPGARQSVGIKPLCYLYGWFARKGSLVVRAEAGQFTGSWLQQNSREEAGLVTSRQAQLFVNGEWKAGNPRIRIHRQERNRCVDREKRAGMIYNTENTLAPNESKFRINTASVSSNELQVRRTRRWSAAGVVIMTVFRHEATLNMRQVQLGG